MKIIQINTVYGTGSTGKIVASLYASAQEHGFEGKAAYGRGKTPTQNHIHGFLIGDKPDFYRHVLYNFIVGSSGFASKKNTTKFLEWLDEEKPDILHLHNLHGFYIHVGLLFDYIKEKNIPVVWTLHDCWPFTGQCAYFDYVKCEKWKVQCYNCPVFRRDYPYSLFRDNSKVNYNLKKANFCGVHNLTIVTPSQWLADLVKESFLKEYPIRVIPNGIDHNIFNPNSKDTILKLCSSHNKILLGVANIWDKRKGLSYMLRLSEDFNSTNGYQIVIIGLSKFQIKQINRTHKNVLALPRTSSQQELAEWYRQAYIYINPTLQDNFPTTNLEALACGTPVITFNTGGSPESLTKETGIVVKKGNYDFLKIAIKNIYESKKNTSDYSVTACYDQSLEFNDKTQFEKYVCLYKSIIQNN